MGGLSLRRRLPQRRTWIGGDWPSLTTCKGQSAPRMVTWPRQNEDREAQGKQRRDVLGSMGAPPPSGLL
jgi:hypothetical protein